MKATHAVVIYHSPCMDGFGSAWAFHTLKEKDYETTEYRGMNYGNHEFYLPELVNNDIYILDFSFPREVLVKLASIAHKVLILDHHKTAQEALMVTDENPWPDRPNNLDIVFDMTRSGAGITWDYFAPPGLERNRSPLIDYIEDRDIWKWKLQGTREINAVITATEQEFYAYSVLDQELWRDGKNVEAAGVLLLKQRDIIIHDIIKACKRPITINGAQGLVCNCSYHFASEVGNILAKESGTFGATYFTASDNKIKFSLRSIGDYDVAAIAKTFGGGGHKNASGFEVSGLTVIESL